MKQNFLKFLCIFLKNHIGEEVVAYFLSVSAEFEERTLRFYDMNPVPAQYTQGLDIFFSNIFEKNFKKIKKFLKNMEIFLEILENFSETETMPLILPQNRYRERLSGIRKFLAFFDNFYVQLILMLVAFIPIFFAIFVIFFLLFGALCCTTVVLVVLSILVAQQFH